LVKQTIFTLFLVGGPSAGTLNGLARNRPSRDNSVPIKLILEISQNHKLKKWNL